MWNRLFANKCQSFDDENKSEWGGANILKTFSEYTVFSAVHIVPVQPI